MANSSKKISKVVAIAMASAMAMSSLSAALVSVSAIADPTASSVGSVDFAKGEKAAIESALGVTDGQIDAIKDRNLDLGALIKASDLNLVYTDENGIERPVDVDEVTFKVTSGSSYAKVGTKDTDTEKKNVLYAKKAGTATLQIKASGTVNLGDSKKEKDVTFTHNITLNIHEDKEIGLAAFQDGVKLTSDDLNDLAAYDVDNITFKLVTYHADPDETVFKAVINDAHIGDDSATKPDVTPDVTVDAIIAELTGADEVAKNALKKDGVLVKGQDGSFEIDLSGLTEEEKKGVLQEAVPYTLETATAEVAKSLDSLPEKATDIEAKKLYSYIEGAVGRAKSPVYFMKKDETLPAGIEKFLEKDPSAGTKYYDKATQKLTDTQGSNTQVDVYKLKDKAEIEKLEQFPAVTLGDTDAATKLIQAAIDKVTGTEKPPVEQKVTVEALKKELQNVDSSNATALINMMVASDDLINETNKGLDENSQAYKDLSNKNTVQATYYGKSDQQVKDAVKGAQGVYMVGADDNYTVYGETGKVVEMNDVKGQKQTIFATPSATNDTVVTLKDQSNILAQTDTNYWTAAKKLHINDAAKKEELEKKTAEDLLNHKTGSKKGIVKIGAEYYSLDGNAPTDFKDSGNTNEFFDNTEGNAVKIVKNSTGYEIVQDSAVHANVGTMALQENKVLKTEQKDSYGFGKDTPEEAQQYAKQQYETAYNNVKNALNKPTAQAENYALDLQPDKEGETKKLASVRFYAGTGAELFDYDKENSNATTGDWEKSTKGGKGGITINEDTKLAAIELANNGKTGTGSVKAYVELSDGKEGDSKTIVAKEEYVLNFKVNKTVDFGAESVTIDKSGGKTIAKNSTFQAIENKSISGYDIRTAGTVTVENGTLGDISAEDTVTVNGGKIGAINANEVGDVIVGDAVVGNIVDAKNVTLSLGASVGTVSAVKVDDKDADGNVTVNDASVTSIDADGNVTIDGATVKGDVKAEGEIKISGAGEDDNGDLLDVTIGGNVIASGKAAKINIENDSDEGVTSVKIAGDVIARYADLQDDDASVVIGSPDTTGVINIAGAAQGEYVQLGGNGLVTLGGVRATNEVDAGDSEGLVADSTLDFNGFNSGINSVIGFAKVKVSDGTAKVSKALTTTTLDLSSDTQLVVSGLTTEDVLGDGTIVAPVGQVTVNGDVDDSALLRLTGEVAKDVIAFKGGKGLADAFDLGGLTVQANRQADGSYNYVVTAQELYGLTASGKNVTLGEGQKKEVTVSADAALPQGASIVWESADEDVATVVGNGNTATITGVEVGNTEITAKIVDSTGKDLGYEVATFTTDVLYAETADVIGSEVSVDTASKNMQVGETYNFLVRDIKDTDNIKLSYDANIVDVKLAQADYNGRGALYTITAKANGSTNIGVSYKGATSNIAVKVGGFVLDTSAKTMNVGTTYSFLAKNVKVEEAGNVQFTYDNTVAKVELAQADYNGRGALFTVTALKTGSTDIKATYNNEEATMKLDVVEYTGKMTLDTASYTMPLGGTYTIGVKIEKNGKQLTGAEVNAMIASGELVVRDSRTGTIINKPEVLANGNVRVTGKNTEGTTYVMFEIVKDGKVATHASIGVTVKAGATAGGSSRRSVSQW